MAFQRDPGIARKVDIQTGENYGREVVVVEALSALLVDTELPAAAALSDSAANPTTPMVGAALMGFDGFVWRRVYGGSSGQLRVTLLGAGGTAISDQAEGDTASNHTGAIGTLAHSYMFSGGSPNSWQRKRGVTSLKTAQGSAVASGSSVDIWTPASGKKFRLFGFSIAQSGAGRLEVLDDATIIGYLRATGNAPVVLGMPANGYQSAVANNVLKVKNQTGGATDLDVIAWGCEE